MNWSIVGKPTEKEMKRALGKLKDGKAAGYSNILPDMVKAVVQSEDFVSMLTELVSVLWENRCVPHEWADLSSFLFPCKKGT